IGGRVMREADDATVQQARRLCDRATRAVEEAKQTLQFAKMRLARWRLESERITAMKSELETLSEHLRALQEVAHEESKGGPRLAAICLVRRGVVRSCVAQHGPALNSLPRPLRH